MVLDVVVHVGIDEAQDRIQVNRAGIQPVIRNVFLKTRVLHGRKHAVEP